ncbi:MAG: lysostaphin resistance A-like protein [Polyangiales bacterium]
MARRRIVSAIVVYGALGAAALGVLFLGDRPLGSHPDPWLSASFPVRLVVSVVGGLALCAFGIVSTRWLVRRTVWARQLHVSFRTLLGPLTSTEILVFALTSGIAEELFFRGALQPWLGFVAASILFGAVHLGPSRKFLPWTLWAIAMGFLFGSLYECTGELVGPVLAHVLVNYENLHFINTHDPSEKKGPSALSASIVGARERGGGSRSWH